MSDRANLTSRKNPLVKEAANLGASAKARKESGLFLVEGARLCEDAAKSGMEIIRTFYTHEAASKYNNYLHSVLQASAEAYVAETHVAELLAQTKHSQGIYCVCRKRNYGPADFTGKQVALENVQDPANLGAVLRTAEALGISSVILAGQTCDIYSPKTLRASMGAVFRMKIQMYDTAESLFAALGGNDVATYASVPDEKARKILDLHFPENCIIFIGNEGGGLSEQAISLCGEKITIPMLGRAESLNAAAAASILMWEMMKS